MQRSADGPNGAKQRPLAVVILDASRHDDRRIIGGVTSFAHA
jgi:hypothetical protein